MEDSDFQSLRDRVEHLERVLSTESLTELRDRVDKLEAATPSGPANSESKRIQEMMEDLYSRVGDLEEEGERGMEGAGVSGVRKPWLKLVMGKGRAIPSLSQRP